MVMLNPTPVKGSKMGMFSQNSIDFLIVCQWLPVGGDFVMVLASTSNCRLAN